MTPVRPLSATETRPPGSARNAASNARMALIARLAQPSAQQDSKLLRLDPLLSLLSDTETLSLFIRHAGLSGAQAAALRRELSTPTPKSLTGRTHILLDDALAKFRPTLGDVNSSYIVHAERSEDATFANEWPANGYRAEHLGAGAQFSAFSPTPQDYAKTVDDVGFHSSRHNSADDQSPPGWFSRAELREEHVRGLSVWAWALLAGAIVLPAVVVFVFHR